MDDVFRALADGSRRELLDRLNERNGQTLRELCTGLEMSRQAVSKHLAVLESAGLVTAVRHGREKLHYLNPVPIHEVADRWIGRYERGRLTALSALKQALEGNPLKKPAFVYTIYIETTAEKLYEALTTPEFLKQYHGGWAPRSDWQAGSTVYWPLEENGEPLDLGQRVLVAEPGKRLVYTWHTLQPMHQEMLGMSDAEFAEASKERSQVAFDVEPAEIPKLGVKLTITHDHFDSAESRMLESVSGGWVMLASQLKSILERQPA
ncbi:metalloregulator ArsR/SmtB family transcription factor [Streptomyces sp. NBC_01808]|uniref:ArsR/SmtB family transcription factor n=1 Tax=Streptomyces sp. NBC_01808 TaxID=2975947 RepID=UPI002DDB128E|nr:metalloregulator ArsR/SmtB family transcription factor [Streptomyces sp. NBC_01808]WSA40972.1 metalloregulator ArsR/SmtB family transcription factor [Streptomyces sp. NBC_01808]